MHSEEKKTDLKIFQKQPTFCHFTKNTRQQSLLHSTKKIIEKFVLQTELSQSDVRTFFALYIRFYSDWELIILHQALQKRPQLG